MITNFLSTLKKKLMLSDFIFKSYRHFKVALNNFSKKLTFFFPIQTHVFFL